MHDEPPTHLDEIAPHETDGPAHADAERESHHGFWSSLADTLLSMPAGIGIRIGG